MRRLAILFAIAALVVPAAAHGDGDPASDILYPYSIFFPFDVSFGKRQQSELSTTVDAAQKRGYVIKVAIITKPTDLGAIPGLFRKPQQYASFLGRELAPFLYKGRLLIVMPNGFGFWWYKHDFDQEQALVSKLTVGQDPTPTQMVVAASQAVRKLAAAAGYRLPVTSASGTGGSGALIGIVAGGVAVLLILSAGTWLWLRRRKQAAVLVARRRSRHGGCGRDPRGVSAPESSKVVGRGSGRTFEERGRGDAEQPALDDSPRDQVPMFPGEGG
jgi:hypothetical protein